MDAGYSGGKDRSSVWSNPIRRWVSHPTTPRRVRGRESEAAADTVASEVLEAAPMAISIPVATSEPDTS